MKRYRLRHIIHFTRTGLTLYPGTEIREQNGHLLALQYSMQYAVNPNNTNGDCYLTRDKSWRRVKLSKRQRRALAPVTGKDGAG